MNLKTAWRQCAQASLAAVCFCGLPFFPALSVAQVAPLTPATGPYAGNPLRQPPAAPAPPAGDATANPVVQPNPYVASNLPVVNTPPRELTLPGADAPGSPSVGSPAVGAPSVTPPGPQSTVQPPAATTPAPATDKITAAEIEARRKQAEETADLPDEAKKKIAELYRQAAEQLAQSEQQAALVAGYKAAADGASERLGKLRQELTDLQQQEAPRPVADSLSELEQMLAAQDLRLKELKAAQAKLEAEPSMRSNRRKELRGLLVSAAQRREELTKQLDAAPPADEPPLLTLARRTEALTRRLLLDKQTPALMNELAKYDAEEAADMLRVQRDLLARQITLAQQQFDLIEAAVRQRREQHARQAVRQAQEEVINAEPVLKSYAEENQKLAEQAQSLATLISQTQQKLKSATERLEGVEKLMGQTKTKVENVGLTGAIGLMLRKQRAELPDVRKRRRNVSQRRSEIDSVQLAMFEYDDQRSDLSTPEPIVKTILQEAGSDIPDVRRERLKAAAENVIERKREYLDTLIRNYNSYFDTLVELDTTERQLISVTQEYQNYIDERVLWIRSARPLYDDVRLDDADYQFVSLAAWQEVGDALWKDVRESYTAYVLAGAALGVLFWWGIRCRREIRVQGEIARRAGCCEFSPTFRAALATQVLVLPLPALLLFLAWRISPQCGREGLPCGLVLGLTAVAMTIFLLQMTRQVCRPGGLGEAHFEWPTAATKKMRRSLRVLGLAGLPLILVAAALKGSDPEHGRDVVERGCLLLIAAMVAIFNARVFSPTTGVFKEYLAYSPTSWLARLKHVWYWGLIGVPVALAGLSLFGYHYTARQLAGRMYITASLVLLLIVARSLMLRLVLIARRKLAMAEARRRRSEQAEMTSASEGAAAIAPVQTSTDGPQADLKTHSVQIQRLIATGLVAASLVGMWCIWSDVVPALGFLDRYSLWTTSVAVTEQVATVGEEVTVATREKIMSVTLADVGLATIIAIVTFVAGKNVPGLLEISVLRRLPLENSVRYAITTMASYAIILVGVIVGCQTIGLRWSQIQWLATALTFGLAFGLQEMFANFVAGLIILFERPVRVGDIVTVDGIDGIVSKIRIRATTITNWDRKEYIVPNKEFITGKVLNWTLSDQTNRIVINVGVAYGSDTKLVHELLLKVATDHPLILETPPSVATFEGFGDSSLNFTLRTFLPNLENRLAVVHALHMAIDEAFREAGIEISFPQRDLHIRTVPKALAALTNTGSAEREAA